MVLSGEPQVRYNLVNRAPEKGGLLKVAAERGVKIVAYAPLAEGQLVGKTDNTKVRGVRSVSGSGGPRSSPTPHSSCARHAIP